MPVNPNVPEPLKSSLEQMEAIVQSTKRSLAFAAPEVVDTHWVSLQQGLASEMEALYDETRAEFSPPTTVEDPRRNEEID